ncbi:MAG: helix-turn-helix transcriptional regulator [Bacteroidia bacterium]|nr:helix-turn-helix transcriptional regulator [Bacteroidia bacterium]
MVTDIKTFDFQGKAIFVKATFKPPFRFVAQMPDDACFYFVKGAKTQVFAPGGSIKFESDEGVVLQCGRYINDYLASADVYECEALAVHFFPDVLNVVYDNDFPDFLVQMNEMTPATFERVESSSLLQAYVESLDFYFENPSLVSDELMKLKLKELLLLLAKTNNVDIIRSLLSGVAGSQRIGFKEVVEANLFNNLSIDELANLTHLSLSSFKREFVRRYDDTPARYIKKRKLEKAAKLLKATDLRISDVAYDCGFNDLAHFSRSFSKMFGCQPSAYRQ